MVFNSIFYILLSSGFHADLLPGTGKAPQSAAVLGSLIFYAWENLYM